MYEDCFPYTQLKLVHKIDNKQRKIVERRSKLIGESILGIVIQLEECLLSQLRELQTKVGTYDSGDNKSSTYFDLILLPYS